MLWTASYPDDVVPLLNRIQESYLMSPISGSEDDGQVTFLSPDSGPVELNRIGGIWRIDASNIINCWNAKRDKSREPPVVSC